MPKCFENDNINVLKIQETHALFARKFEITLAPLGRCAYFGTGSTKLDWVDPFNSAPVLWTYSLNYTKGECRPYGG